MTGITEHLASVRARVGDASRRAGRSLDDVVIVAVSKQQSAESIRAAYRAGQRHFGESYVQEALPKLAELAGLDVVWHFIGRMQANKTRAVAENFAWVHTVDRERIAARLSAQRPRFAAPLNVLIQVNVAGDEQKAGVPPAEMLELAGAIGALPNLRLRGLMTIPPADEPPDATRAHFRRLRELYADLARTGHEVDTLSMGMSADFELAIECGSTCLRIGTAIFGPRAG